MIETCIQITTVGKILMRTALIHYFSWLVLMQEPSNSIRSSWQKSTHNKRMRLLEILVAKRFALKARSRSSSNAFPCHYFTIIQLIFYISYNTNKKIIELFCHLVCFD